MGAGETGRSLALGPGPDGIRTDWKYKIHPKSFQGVRPISDCDPMTPCLQSQEDSPLELQGSPQIELSRGGRVVKEIFVLHCG